MNKDFENDDVFNSSFWNERWRNQQTGWDIGYPSPAIGEYMRKYENKDAAILIPGCGNAYEAEFLVKEGFTNVTILDIAPIAVEKLKEKFKDKSEITIICDNFFDFKGAFDVIIEQTFFCAIMPSLRKAYVKNAASLLKDNGRIIGLLFNKKFDHNGPPYGGSKEEYLSLFQPFFKIDKMEICLNSIPPRMGNELFINLLKK
ncbi:MAG TPA: methyltransferase domain-containing protein [Edaphocola sp.]|nr:methyltransferase domain-containing protein [Edaphocola sp.]